MENKMKNKHEPVTLKAKTRIEKIYEAIERNKEQISDGGDVNYHTVNIERLKNKMKNYSKKLTLEEATELYNSEGEGLQMWLTDHNIKMMQTVIDNHIIELKKNDRTATTN